MVNMTESEESAPNHLSGDFSGNLNSPKLNYYGLNVRQFPAWLDVKVIYLRVSFGSQSEDSPDALVMRFPERSIETSLEVNGGRISPSEETSLVLRRDRVDKDSLEVTYVTTDKLRAVGSIAFEIYESEDILVCGVLARPEPSDVQDLIGQDPASVSLLAKYGTSGWVMECNCVLRSTSCSFLKGRHEYASLSYAPPLMEICVVGQYSASPVMLTQTVELAARKRMIRHGTLDAIPEDKECGVPQSKILADIDMQGTQEAAFGALDAEVAAIDKYYGSESGAAYLEGDDGDISWFNAGVRVGVGIGLGMCLGIGIGVGLLVRTYQVATRSFKRQLF